MAEELARPVTESTPEAPGANQSVAEQVPDIASDSTTPQQPPVQQMPSFSTPQKDIVMSDALDAPLDQTASPAPGNLAPSPAPARIGTSTPAHGSRAASLHPDPGFAMPSEAPPHGDSTRRYLNTRVTGVLLEGMKQVAKDQPNDPLRFLGEYLTQRSKELEGTG